jgi:hypothetical protein
MQSNSVLNTVAATAGDISLLARKLNVAITSSTGAGTFPTMKYALIDSATVTTSRIETANNVKFSYTAADNTEYSFTVIQDVNGTPVPFLARVEDSGTGATNTTIGDALVASLNGQGVNATAAHAGADAFVTVVGDAGFPLFTGLSGTNVTATSNLLSAVTILSNTTATPTVFTASAAHGLVVGNVITITTSDVTKFVAGTYRVRTVPLTTTFTLEQLTTRAPLAGTATATGTITLVAQQAQGQGADLAAAGVEGAIAGNQYSTYVFNYSFETPGSGGTSSTNSGNQHILYVAEGTASTSPTTNFGNFDARMREIYNAFVASATTFDPQTGKVANV